MTKKGQFFMNGIGTVGITAAHSFYFTQKQTRTEEQPQNFTIDSDSGDSSTSDTDGVVSGQSVYELYQKECAGTNAGIVQTYQDVSTQHYDCKVDSEAGCVDIYDKNGNHLGAFDYADLEIKADAQTGAQLLISEHGTACYDALALNEELKDALCEVTGQEQLAASALSGYEVKTHSETGIQYLVRNGEAGRGGTVLIQSDADWEKYEQLADTYRNQYPNLVKDTDAALIYADLEIKGLTERTANGIITIGFNGVSYNDNLNYKNNWSVLYSQDVYDTIAAWFDQNKDKDTIEKISSWDILNQVEYERVWSKEELEQGYLNN